MHVAEIVEGKEYRLLTDIGVVGYTPADDTKFLALRAGSIVTVNKVVTDLHSVNDGNWPHTVIVAFGKDDACEFDYTGLVSPNFLEEV